MAFWIYMLRCADQSYYVGHTDDLDQRVAAHHAGECGYTASRRPVEVVFVDEAQTREEAFIRERQIKGWTRAKKEALIARNWERLHQIVRAEWVSEGLPHRGENRLILRLRSG